MSLSAADDLGPSDGETWINCAHQGPLPRVSVEALNEAASLKIRPQTIDDEMFFTIPRRLKEALGRLLNVSHDEVILGNSTSYGLHLIANGMRWEEGDEVLLVEGDFPADIMPWLDLRKKGVSIKFIRPRRHVPSSEELVDEITDRTRLFCTTWVNSFTGHLIDIEGIGGICREHGVVSVVNGTQALGAKALNLKRTNIDAFTSCGFKWLCGPYGTGFCWIEPDLLGQLECNQAYWLTLQEGVGLEGETRMEVYYDLGAKRFDVFGTANFLNFMPWTASVEYLLSKGISSIEEHNEGLVEHLVKNIDLGSYEVVSPQIGEEMSSIAVLDHLDGRNREIHARLLKEGYYISLRNSRLRISPHLYNSMEEMDAVLDLLNQPGLKQ
jgi:selenocysteine lyase/cysteine desulfurase